MTSTGFFRHHQRKNKHTKHTVSYTNRLLSDGMKSYANQYSNYNNNFTNPLIGTRHDDHELVRLAKNDFKRKIQTGDDNTQIRTKDHTVNVFPVWYDPRNIMYSNLLRQYMSPKKDIHPVITNTLVSVGFGILSSNLGYLPQYLVFQALYSLLDVVATQTSNDYAKDLFVGYNLSTHDTSNVTN